MKRIDGFLSRKAQSVLEHALVLCFDEGAPNEKWFLQREGEEDIGLGSNFREARSAVEAWVSAAIHGQSRIFSWKAGGMNSGWQTLSVETVRRSGSALEFWPSAGNPVMADFDSEARAKEVERSASAVIRASGLKLGNAIPLVRMLIDNPGPITRACDVRTVQDIADWKVNWKDGGEIHPMPSIRDGQFTRLFSVERDVVTMEVSRPAGRYFVRGRVPSESDRNALQKIFSATTLVMVPPSMAELMDSSVPD